MVWIWTPWPAPIGSECRAWRTQISHLIPFQAWRLQNVLSFSLPGLKALKYLIFSPSGPGGPKISHRFSFRAWSPPQIYQQFPFRISPWPPAYWPGSSHVGANTPKGSPNKGAWHKLALSRHVFSPKWSGMAWEGLGGLIWVSREGWGSRRL